MSNYWLKEMSYEKSQETTLPLKNTQDCLKNASSSTTRPWTHADLGIPTTFQILGHEVTVLLVEIDDIGKFGDSDMALNTIRLFTSGSCRDVILHTYWHEVTHFLLHYAGRSDLSEDESLVDVLGGLIKQVLSTS